MLFVKWGLTTLNSTMRLHTILYNGIIQDKLGASLADKGRYSGQVAIKVRNKHQKCNYSANIFSSQLRDNPR